MHDVVVAWLGWLLLVGLLACLLRAWLACDQSCMHLASTYYRSAVHACGCCIMAGWTGWLLILQVVAAM
jgi:hypothetical protein